MERIQAKSMKKLELDKIYQGDALQVLLQKLVERDIM